MPIIKEITTRDAETNFSKYAAALLDGSYDEILVKDGSAPLLRILPCKQNVVRGLDFGAANKRGHLVVSDDWDMDDGDAEVATLLEKGID